MPVLRRKDKKSSKSKKSDQEKKKVIPCRQCAKPCKGEVLKVQEDFFHVKCFQCSICACSLSQGGFFIKEGKYYCHKDYQENFGTKCHGCSQFLEGEVVTALGNTYHKNCFACVRCGHAFEGGEDITYDPSEDICLCLSCSQADPPLPEPRSVAPQESKPAPPKREPRQPRAKKRHFSPPLFNGIPLRPGEKVNYNGKDVLCDPCSDDPDGPILSKKETTAINGTQEAERPLQSEGVNIRCFNCGDIISQGQALVALDKHWHVWCFKCTVCKKVLSGEYMGRDGKPYCDRDYHRLYGIKCSLCEIYITGKVLEAGDMKYHPTCAKCCRCGNHFAEGEDMFIQGTEIWHPDCSKGFYHFSPAQIKEHALLYDYNRNKTSINFEESPVKSSNSMNPQNPNLCISYLPPDDDIPIYPRPLQKTPEPASAPHFHTPAFVNPNGNVSPSSSGDFAVQRGPFRPRPRSAFDGLRPKLKPHKDENLSNFIIKQAKFSAAQRPGPNEVPKVERPEWPGPPLLSLVPRRNKSKSMNDLLDPSDRARQDKVKKEIEQVDSALGKEIIRAELEKEDVENLDPRSASRTPSASKEPTIHPRYDNSYYSGAIYTRYYSYPHDYPGPRGSTLPPSSRYTPSELYKKTGSLPASARYSPGYMSDHEGLSEGYISNGYDSSGEMSPGLARMTEQQLRNLRISKGRSLPSMEHKIYPLELLLTTNYRLPKDVSRANLELHLSDHDFYRAFGMNHDQFLHLPRWKQVTMKKRALLF